MKTFNKKDVYSWSNAEEAKQYIGKKGYFANKLSIIEAMVQYCRNGDQYTLQEIDCDDSLCFGRKIAGTIGYQWDSLFLPADKIKEIEEPKRWRAFTLEEFLDRFSIGTKISFRRRDITRSTYGLFEGYQTDIDETETYHKIIICNLWYTLDDLFEKYEYLDEHGEWKSFGVEE